MKFKNSNILKSKGIILLLFVFTNYSNAQQVILPPTVAKAKLVEKQRLQNKINTTFSLPIADSTFLQYESAFWAMMTLETKPKAALPKIEFALQNFTKYDNSFQNGLLEIVYSLYPKEYEKEIANLIKDTNITAKQFAVFGEYLYRINKKYKKIIQASIAKKKFNDYLNTLEIKLNHSENNYWYAEVLKSLLQNKFLQNKSVIISLQNKNRNHPGLVLIRDSTGKIIQQNDTIFYTQQLARAVTNLPYYISNGNTPQGIFRINGFGFSKNNSIGPTENFQLCMPYECNVKDFFDEKILDSVWNDDIFNSIIPTEINNYYHYPLHESQIAGKLGRYEIISHGTTVNNEYYKGQPYYGFTPTAGCLQAKEVWDYTTGKRLYSDQQKLIDAFKSTGAVKGYLIVLDIIDEKRNVTINDFKKMIQ